MKKLLSILLCASILLTAFVCCGLTAFAEELPVDEEPADAVEPDEPAAVIHVPQIRIHTADGNGTTLQKADGYVDATIEITDTDGSVTEGDVSFKVRGNGTAMPSILKKAYTFKFSKKRDVLGLGKGKKWALLANAMDVTLLRNYIAFDFGQELGIRYTSEQKMAEVWVDDSFRGLYLLTEPVQEGKDRVDIDIESNDGMKDFLLELEAGRKEEGVSYVKTGGIRFAVSEPEEPNADQLNYINQVLSDVVKKVMTGTEEEIREAIDVASFVRFYILNEYVKTVDFNYSSVFFYYQDGKLCAGPPWDYDHAMGSGSDVKSGNYQNAAGTEGVFAGTEHFYKYLCRYEWFMDEVKQAYADHHDYIKNIAADGGLIDSLAETYIDEINRNFSDAGWSITKVWSVYQRKPLPTYQENIDFLKAWCQARVRWLDGYLLSDKYYYLGDADCDNEVTIYDASLIQLKLAELPSDPFDFDAADADFDGTVTVFDVTAIQRHLAEIKISPYIGQLMIRES